ncbi:MAG: phage terminase large subunit family protein, partial [Planctomycetaceae bacterium]|nr:phage terminase large subunit family protein [Planctomycetaceae bacterium]
MAKKKAVRSTAKPKTTTRKQTKAAKKPPVRSKSPAKKQAKAAKKPPVRSKSPAKKQAKPSSRSCRLSSSSVSPVPKTSVRQSSGSYEAHKERQRERQAEQVRQGQDIGAIPPPKNPKRRKSCERNLDLFYRTYFPNVFCHPWSRVHVRLIKLIMMAVLMGAMLAVGIPRGFGKTSMCVRAVIWAIAYQHHTLVMLFAATNEAAAELIRDIHTELTTNELLIEDFPELCLPLIAVGSANQKGRGQTCEGKPTNVKVRSNELWTGDVGGRIGASIWGVGITAGGIRGKRRTVDGRVLRPTLGLADDCQTRGSAISERQVNRRKNILEADLPGLPGQSESWSFLSTWTVIEPDDCADWVLNREKAPDYHGVRERFLDALPGEKAMDHWIRWNEIRIRCQQAAGCDINLDDWEDGDVIDFEEEDPLEEAHEYYDRHRKAMDRGAKVVWEHAYNPKRYRSALEKAMHWYFRNRLAFFSELQNDPGAFEVTAKPQLQKFDVASRFGPHTRGKVPRDAQWLTIGIDVQGKCLFWSVRAWSRDSTSWVIDYGAFPGQNRHYFTLSDVKLSIDAVYSALPTWDVRMAKALKDLLDGMFSRQWDREDGLKLGLTAGGVDANYETQAVKAAVAASGYYGRIYPTHGHSFRPPKTPLNDTTVRDRDVVGDNWRLRAPKAGDVMAVTFDCDVFKSFQRDRLLMEPLQPGSLTLCKGPSHDMWADHMCAERCHEVTDNTTKRTADVWEQLPHRPDNHFLDCEGINNVVGAMIGCRLPMEGTAPAPAVAAMPTSAHPQQVKP